MYSSSSRTFLHKASITKFALSFLVVLALKASVGHVILGGMVGLGMQIVNLEGFWTDDCQIGRLLRFL